MSALAAHSSREINKAHFANWAIGEINSNLKRSILAEYIVAEALDCLTEYHEEWNFFDIDYKGSKVEVKSSGYVTPPFISTKSKPVPRFDIAPRKWAWSNESNSYLEADAPIRRADLYVFAATLGVDEISFQPLQRDRWVFCVAETIQLNEIFGSQKTVSLTSLKPHFRIVGFDELKQAVDQTRGEIK